MPVTITITKTVQPKPKQTKRFQVLLMNDDYTAMAFVVEVLKRFFNKSETSAQEIMLKVHLEGKCVCGTYGFDIAQTKVAQVIDFSRKNEQPLHCVLRELS